MKYNDEPCPRCGCPMSLPFECGCGSVHDEHCANCGRWRSLPPTEHVTLSEVDVRCGKREPHVHHPSESVQRIKAWQKRTIGGR